MGGFWNRLTGGQSDFPTPDDQKRRRLARMRHNVWLGVCVIRGIAEATGGELVMYTLTYERVGQWEPRHICNCMRWLRRQGIRLYVWVAELQKRGAVHYHVLAMLPHLQRWRKPTATDGGWARGFTWVTPGIRRPLYIMKYLQKGQGSESQHTFPKGFRLYAVAQEVMRRAEFTDALAWRAGHLPAWAACDSKDDCIILGSRRVTGGVRYGPAVECSPYSRRALPDLERVGRQMMYNLAVGCKMPQQ